MDGTKCQFGRIDSSYFSWFLHPVEKLVLKIAIDYLLAIIC